MNSKEIFIREEMEPMLNLTWWTFQELYGQEIFLAEHIKETISLLEVRYNQEQLH